MHVDADNIFGRGEAGGGNETRFDKLHGRFARKQGAVMVEVFTFLSFPSIAKDRLPVHWIRHCFDSMFVMSARAMTVELFESSFKLC